MKFVRMGVITAVLAVLAALSAVSLDGRRADSAGEQVEQRLGLLNEMVTADPAGTLDSTWYCAATRVLEAGSSKHEVLISNGSDEPVNVELRAVPLNTKAKVQPPQKLEVAANSVVVFDASTLSKESSAAVVVEVRSGEVVVSHRLTNGTGSSQAPCTSRPSGSWDFPYVNTEKDATARLFLFNPYPVAVSVDVTLSTTEYVRVPAELSGESVAPGQVKVINLNERAPRRDRLSVSVRSRSGLLIAEVVQTFSKDNLEFNLSSGEGGDGKVDKEEIGEQPVKRRGVALVSGSPQATTHAGFVDGFTQGGVIEQYVVLNPSDQNADVQPIWITPYGQPRDEIEPLAKVIPPGRAETISLDQEQRIPPEGFHHGLVIADRGVASARVLVSVDERKDSTASGDQLRPKPATGISISPGMPLAADRWWSGGITLSGDDEGWLLVDNPSSTDSASIKLLVHGDGKVEAAEGLDDFKIEAGGQLAIDLRSLKLPAAALVELRSTAPVQVEQRLVSAAAGDYSSGPAIPDASTVVSLSDVVGSSG